MEGELQSPPPCPRTVTVRRNPIRRARATPSSIIPLPLPLSSPIPLLSIEIPNIQPEPDSQVHKIPFTDESLKVFLRIRPFTVHKALFKEGKRHANVWPKIPKSKDLKKEKEKKGCETCVRVIDNHSVIVSPPLDLQVTKRFKSEVYEGFSNVFSADSSQSEVYQKMVSPLVKDLLNGKSGVLAALGPSGSGKTHTVFGCARDPGMVPRVLCQIFSDNETHLARTFHLSMFEICSEKGKSERLSDLLQEGFVYMQQSTIKGLKEVLVTEAQQAESVIACGMLKRATATTNSNSQSSRSQCIINIRCGPKKVDGETEDESSTAVLTIVDLAGAEREKRTGNQGLRLLESNFINNTSMVFGLCLRSLLEHQKNPKKRLQKNFQNSLLTRYLKPYLEGKKRMALVLTVKPGEEDYLDTSNLLKQASPFSQIRFSSTEEPGNSKCAKRPSQISQREENKKKKKFNGMEVDVIDERAMDEKQQSISSEKVEDDHLAEISVKSKANGLVNSERNPIEAAKREREQQIMVQMSKALWNVLNQYKQKLKVADDELNCLRVTLANEQKIRVDLEDEVKNLKSQISHRQKASDEESEESAENDTSIIDTVDFKNDFEEETHLSNENVEDLLFLRVEDSIDSSSESSATDHSESSVSSSELCATTKRSSHLLAAEMDKLAHKDCEKEVDLDVKVSLDGNDSLTQEREDCRAPDIASKHVGSDRFENMEKRKRRLPPVSSNLLMDMDGLSLDDDNDTVKFKGSKGEKKVSEDMKNKSERLLRLLI